MRADCSVGEGKPLVEVFSPTVLDRVRLLWCDRPNADPVAIELMFLPVYFPSTVQSVTRTQKSAKSA